MSRPQGPQSQAPAGRRQRRWEPATVGTVALAVVLLVVAAVLLGWGRLHDSARPAAAEVPASPAVLGTPATGSVAPSASGTAATSASDEPVPAVPTAPPAQRVVERHAPILPVVRVHPAKKVVPPLTFRVSSFNMLGASHTVPGGEHEGRAAGPVRARWGSALLRGAGVTVAGLQELEPSQYAAFAAATPGWQAYPGTRLVRKSTANSIVWDDSVWELVEAHTIEIPYFHGKQTPMPYLKLRDRETGREVWFANFHNPADVHGPAARWRSVAVAREVALANQLTAGGDPLVITGDMNDREAYFCPMTTRTQMHAALGGSTGPVCSPPGDMTVDWIMGSPDVVFANYHSIRGGLVEKTSDHHLLWTDATVGALPAPAE
jgi:hypothetical protein